MARPTDVDDSGFNFICEDGVITDPPRASNSGIASEMSSAEASSALRYTSEAGWSLVLLGVAWVAAKSGRRQRR